MDGSGETEEGAGNGAIAQYATGVKGKKNALFVTGGRVGVGLGRNDAVRRTSNIERRVMSGSSGRPRVKGKKQKKATFA